MRTSALKAAILAIGIVVTAGLATNVFAGKGYGRGFGGSENGDRGWDCPGYGQRADLSQEQVAKLDNERKAFFDATSELRREIRHKNLELQTELTKKEVDAAKARSIQKELSDLEAQFDQKRLDQRIKMAEAYPDWHGGPGRHFGRGMGRQGGRW